MLSDSEQLKIVDFGLARKLTDNVECREMLGTPEFVGTSLFVCLPVLCVYVCQVLLGTPESVSTSLYICQCLSVLVFVWLGGSVV